MDINDIYKAIAIKNNCDEQQAQMMIIMDILKNDHITRKAIEIAIKRKYSNILKEGVNNG